VPLGISGAFIKIIRYWCRKTTKTEDLLIPGLRVFRGIVYDGVILEFEVFDAMKAEEPVLT